MNSASRVLAMAVVLAMLLLACGDADEAPLASGQADERTDAESVNDASEESAVDFPTGPLEILIPFNPGGSQDLAARTFARLMNEELDLDHQVNNDNMPGAAGLVGLNSLATDNNSDGHRIGQVSTHIVASPLTSGDSFHHEDVTLVARTFTEWNGLIVRDDSPIETIEDAIETLREDPSAFRFGGGTIGGHHTIATNVLALELDIEPQDINYVAYDGGEAVPAVLGGHIEAVWGGPEFIDLIDAGELRVIGVTMEDRVESLPDAPTFVESDVDVVVFPWRVMVGPPDMTEEALSFWQGALRDVMDTDEWATEMDNYGWVDSWLTGPEADAWLDDERTRHEEILRTTGVID